MVCDFFTVFLFGSEFKVQGLEIDWAVVCWDADLRRKDKDWDYYSFRGTKWTKRNKEDQQRYLLNSYRVLLTRARERLYLADEVFFTGTAAEVTPIRAIDNRQIGIGKRGPITKEIQDAYFELVLTTDQLLKLVKRLKQVMY